ncbi:MAG TPA: adenylate/guanylate cyclase domain-containing protein [Gaiellaceae bacterium]|nr:adenylate/guanylate cyclase domain-containing protein [Gaiellaceae bacterium]
MTVADETFLLNLMRTIGDGVAVFDPEDLSVVFENGHFFEWFPPDEEVDDSLSVRLPSVDLEQARTRIERRGKYTFDAEAGEGARKVSLAGEMREVELAGRTYLVVEVHDVTKQREAEYLLDSYSTMVERHTRDLQREKDRVEKLLLNIMPRAVYEEMRDSGFTTPQRFDDATILMLDFVGFTEMAISRDPTGLITELNDIFTVFDRIVEHFGCDRMKTIGDAYMAVSGIPESNVDHADSMARAAVRMRRYIEKRNASHAEQWHCRIGIHSGPVIGSIVGVQKYVYDVFGPGVNLASRMEELAEPMQILVSADTHALINDEFELTDLGEHEVKGFGAQRVYALVGEGIAARR